MKYALVFRACMCAAILSITTCAVAKKVTIEMLNNSEAGIMVFEPAVVKVELGDEVIFKSTDPGHQVTFIDGPTGYGGPWQSELSQDFTIVPKVPGTYSYICPPHLLMGMIGVLQVGSAVNVQAAEKAFSEQSKNIQLNKDRLASYIKDLKDLR